MSRTNRIGTALVIIIAVLMATSPVAMAAAGTGSSSADAPDNASVDTVLTQSTDDVSIAPELQEDAQTDETVEVFVQLDASSSEFVSDTADETMLTADSQASLEYEAELTQQPLEEYADQSAHVELVSTFWITNGALVEVDADELDELAKVDGVTELHPNYEIDRVEPDPDSDVDAQDVDEVTYGLEQINAPQFWDEFDASGEGATVAVVDSGVNPDHETFSDYDTDNWAEFDFDGSEIDSEPYDENGHGTHVAGTVLGGDESNTQIGVAPDAELYAINVFPEPDEGTTLAAIIAGLELAVEEDVDIANFSLGGAGFAPVYIDLIKNAKEAGTYVVSSSGNAGPGSTGTPANVYNATAIGATGPGEQVTGFSTGAEVDTADDWGEFVAPESWPGEYVTPDVSAPGEGVLSADVPGDDTYEQRSGTSMAAPHVSGTAALLMSEYDVEPSEVKDVLEETATKPSPDDISDDVVSDARLVSDEQVDNLADDDTRDARYGYGIIDAYSAGVSLEGDNTTVKGTVTDSDGDPVADAVVSLDDVRTTETNAAGEFSFDVLAGKYDLTVTAFGGVATETVTVDENETIEEDIQLEDVVDVEVVEDQPAELPANSSVEVVVETANLENLTVDFGPNADINETDLELVADEEELELNESIDFEEPVTNTTTLTVEVAGEEGDVVELEHTFSGPGDDVVVTTGPTSVLDEDAEAAPVTITEWDPPEEVFYNQESPVFVNVTNNGDFTEEVTLLHAVDIFGAGFGPFPIETTATVEANETKEVTLGPYPWWVVGPPGTAIDHQVAVNDVPTQFGGEPDDESAVATTELVDSGQIQGTVTDADTGQPVTGAVVTAEHQDGETFTTTTGANGEYAIAEPQELPAADYNLTVEVEGGYDGATDTVSLAEDNEPATADFELTSEPVYTLSLDGDEPTAFGIPGPIEGETIADIFPGETPGAVYTHNTDENEWVSVGGDHEVSALDAFVFVPNGESAEITFELAETDGEPLPTDRSVDEGWNFLTPSVHDAPGAAFKTTADKQLVQGFQQSPASSMVPEPAFDGFSSLDGDGDAVSPFAGYFAFVADDGVQAGVLSDDGLSLSEANDRLAIDRDRVDGTVVGEFSGEPVDGAVIDIEGTPIASQTGPFGEFGFNHVADEEATATIEADGFEDATVSLNETVELQEEQFLGVTDLETPDSAAVGEEIEVTYEVTNLGTQPVDRQVDVEVGQNVQFARIDESTYTLDTRSIELEPGENETVTITAEVGEFQAGGPQEIGVITNSIGVAFDDVETEPFSIIDVDATDQALGVDEDGNSTVVVNDVTADDDSLLAVTYTDGDDEIIAGGTPLEDGATEASVPVPIVDDTGFPGEHTAHVISDLSDQSADDPIGSPVSEETEDNITAQNDFHVFDAELVFEDQAFADPTDEVVVDEVAVLDGADNETPYTIDLHPTDDEGQLVPDEAVGQSDTLTGENDDVTINLSEELDTTDEFVAMIHLGESEEPLTTPALLQAVDGDLFPVVDDATIEVGTEIDVTALDVENDTIGQESTYDLTYVYESAAGEENTSFISVDFGADSANLSEAEADVSGAPVSDVSEADDGVAVIELEEPIDADTDDVVDVTVEGVENADEATTYDLTVGLHEADEQGEPIVDPFAAASESYELDDDEETASLTVVEPIGESAVPSLAASALG